LTHGNERDHTAKLGRERDALDLLAGERGEREPRGGATLLDARLHDRREAVTAEPVDARAVEAEHAQVVGHGEPALLGRLDGAEGQEVALADDRREVGVRVEKGAGRDESLLDETARGDDGGSVGEDLAHALETLEPCIGDR
jgi:hypothetical protein